MVKSRRAPESRDGPSPRAAELRTAARPPRRDRAPAGNAGARSRRGAEAVRRGHRAVARGARATHRRRGAGEAGALGQGRQSQGRGFRRLTAPSRPTSRTPAPVWMRPSKPGAPGPTPGGATRSRLRPTLVFASAEAGGGAGAGVAELAAAVEVVHAYSLVHDDLPCMDNDDLRRGRPTTHRAFDVGTAT